MKYDLVSSNYFNIGHLDLNTFRSFSDRKKDFIKRIFVDNEQYDVITFYSFYFTFLSNTNFKFGNLLL